MMRALPFIALCLLLLPGAALAQGAPSLRDLETGHQRYVDHLGRLEGRLNEHGKIIGRLKAQAPGMRRDLQLEKALQQSQELARKMAELQQDIHQQTAQLIAAYDRIMASTTDAGQRAALKQRRDHMAADLSTSSRTRIVTDEEASPLDSPEDLEEKADLLEDSRDKIRRQLQQIQRQLLQLHHRRKLERHGSAADDTPFDESSTGLVARSAGKSGDRSEDAAAPAAKQDTGEAGKQGGTSGGGGYTNQSGSTPAPGPKVPGDQPSGLAGIPGSGGAPPNGRDPSGSSYSGANGSATGRAGAGLDSAASSGARVTLQEALNPALLRELSRPAHTGGDLDSRISTLEEALRKLSRMADQLQARSKNLRSRAGQLRGGK